ncbi:hypothetical protein QBC43DRAFT_313851 [Cladorrhinum sp. PSN259]|nr:hypothetical protein QBC43DRAFT_313851 [Cladorrhinum sp. PSN259]
MSSTVWFFFFFLLLAESHCLSMEYTLHPSLWVMDDLNYGSGCRKKQKKKGNVPIRNQSSRPETSLETGTSVKRVNITLKALGICFHHCRYPFQAVCR